MAKVSGKTGFVNVSASTVLGIKDWTLDYTIDPLETTDFNSSGAANYITGVCRWTGSFSGYKDGIFLAIGTATVSMSLAATSVATTAFTGNAFITGVHSGAAVDGVATVAYDYTGTGALVVPTT
jgi:hypothetical protein